MPTTDAARHILAINNEAAVLALFRDLLEVEGYRVTTQVYVDKDLDAIVGLTPDLIILDYMWPEEDAGWSLLQMLRMDPRTVRIPIVLCTGAVREVEALRGHLAEMGSGSCSSPSTSTTSRRRSPPRWRAESRSVGTPLWLIPPSPSPPRQRARSAGTDT